MDKHLDLIQLARPEQPLRENGFGPKGLEALKRIAEIVADKFSAVERSFQAANRVSANVATAVERLRCQVLDSQRQLWQLVEKRSTLQIDELIRLDKEREERDTRRHEELIAELQQTRAVIVCFSAQEENS